MAVIIYVRVSVAKGYFYVSMYSQRYDSAPPPFLIM